MQEDLTVQTISQSCMRNFLVISPQQLTNLYSDVNDLLEIFNRQDPEKGTKKYAADQEYLKQLFFNPIKVLREKYGTSLKLPRRVVDWDISNIEWIYYRSIRFATKLSAEFPKDSKKPTEKETLFLSNVLAIHALFKREVRSIFNKILVAEKIQLSFDFTKIMGGLDAKDRNDIGLGM